MGTVLQGRGPDRARIDAEQREKDEVATRIRRSVAGSRITNAEFASLVGTSASRLSTYMTGKVTPSAAMLIRIERMAARLAETSDMGAGTSAD